MAESTALKKCWKKIIDAIGEADVVAINAYLFSKEVYSKNERDEIDSKQTANDKMSALLKALERKIKRSPAAFDTFLQALREESAYDDLADKLANTRDKLAAKGWSLSVCMRE